VLPRTATNRIARTGRNIHTSFREHRHDCLPVPGRWEPDRPGRPDRAPVWRHLPGASQSWLPFEHQRTARVALGLFNSEQGVWGVSRCGIRPRAPLWWWLHGVLTSPGTAEVGDSGPRARGGRCEARCPVEGLSPWRSRVHILSIPSLTFRRGRAPTLVPGKGLSSLRSDPKIQRVGVR
jgi:hypothetical protein